MKNHTHPTQIPAYDRERLLEHIDTLNFKIHLQNKQIAGLVFSFAGAGLTMLFFLKYIL